MSPVLEFAPCLLVPRCGQMASGGNGFMTSLNMWQVFSKKLLLDDIADDKSVLSHKPEVLETFCKTVRW